MKFSFSRLLVLLVTVILLISQAAAQVVVEILDPNLEGAIREALQVPLGTPITQQEMERLERLDAYSMNISDLTRLEYAINLERFRAWDNPISDLTPLANLTKLRVLDLGGCQIVDLTPLQNLTQLTYLQLSGNPIVDLTPLANLTQLQELKLQDIPAIDFSPIEHLSIPLLIFDYPCELPYLPIKERLQNRTFPSIFSAFGRVKHNYRSNSNLHGLSPEQRFALHDLNWHMPYFGLKYMDTPQGWKLTGFVERSQEVRDSLLKLNPNMLFLVEVRVRDAWIGYYPEDFSYWLRDENRDIVKDRYGFLLTDFTQPAMQDIIVQEAVSASECGLFDGIFFDWFAEAGHLVLHGYYSYEEEQHAKDNILQRIRASVRDDFLIIINTNRKKIPRRAWGINGTFMETLSDTQHGLPRENGNPYGLKGLKQIENTLTWAEENLREPQINCLEGWGDPGEPPDSPTNKRFMRVFTTMSLTHSDGYVLYGMNNTHEHIWYDFWNADLGYPIGSKAQFYQNIEGLFIREFTNGWAVYNRSGKPQSITLPQYATGVSSAKQGITHLLSDLDGEMYLKAGVRIDINADGVVNVLDLILVSQYFGTTKGDVNGDGVTNILDLTLIAQHFNP